MISIALKSNDIKERNFGLDLVRACAILMVLMSHGRVLLPDFSSKILFANGSFFGVELFFVLSGFLIGRILIKAINNSPVLDMHLIKNFWIRRWFRTIPNYLLFLLLNITIFQHLFGDKAYDFKYFFFLQNFLWQHPSLMPEAWSLSVEEWFYLTIPLVILAFSYIGASHNRSLFIGITFYISIFTILRFSSVILDNPSFDAGIRKVVVYRLDSIGYGVLMAYMMFYHKNLMLKYKTAFLLVGSLLLTALALIFSYGLFTDIEKFFNKTFLFSFTSIGISLLFPWLIGLQCSNMLLTKIVTFISIISYSMYLVHLSFTLPFLHKFIEPNLQWYYVYTIYFTLTVFISLLVYRFFEKPILDMRKKFSVSNV